MSSNKRPGHSPPLHINESGNGLDWKSIAAALSAKGQNGDTELVHVNPKEKILLALFGGSGDTNPKTGLTEYSDSGVAGATGNDTSGISTDSGGLGSRGALESIGAAGADIGGRMAGSLGGGAGIDLGGDFKGLQGLGGDSLSGRAQGPSTMDLTKGALGLFGLLSGGNPFSSVAGGVPGLILKDYTNPGTVPSQWDVMSAVMGPAAIGAYGLNQLMSALGVQNRGLGPSSTGVGDMNYVDLLGQLQSGFGGGPRG